MMFESSTVKSRFIQFFMLTIGLLFLGSVLALHQLWRLQEQEVRAELNSFSAETINLVEGSILTASKAVNIAANRIYEASHNGPLTDKQSFEILHSTIENFTFENNANIFGLLFYVNKDGIIRAENSGYPAAHKDVNDRFYFKELSSHPNQRFSIGSLVIGKTNQKITFHFSESLPNADGVFKGLVIQQIDADVLTQKLTGAIKDEHVRIYVQTPAERVIFAYPKELMLYFISPEDNNYVISGKINPKTSPIQIIDYFDKTKASSYDYVGVSQSRYFGLVAYARLSFYEFLYAFLRHQFFILAYMLVGALLLGFAFFQFYKNTVELNQSQHSANHDVLTGLFNRRHVDEILPILWREAMRDGTKISALFIDIDHFKIFNDSYGHECGDIALKAVAEAIQSCVNRPLDMCCRWGGEEFAVLLPSTDEKGAILIANSILDGVRSIELNFVDMKHPQITVSIGVATATVTANNRTDDLIDMADKAMYIAKQSGRNSVRLYQPKE